MSEPSTEVQLREDGVLWMINRTVFHPRGFALGFTPVSGELTLYGNGSEPWHYDEAMNDVEDELFINFESLLARQRKKAL